MTTEAAAKKDIQKLQRVIIDGLEDVKAQDIQVFDTEHLSALFERVIIASGTSNRQTKALAMSVRDAVREANFGKPRLEGESNGEWIIVDCGAAVVHIMQPAIRQYYHLEELWGDKPVRLKFGAVKPAVAAAVAEEAPAKKKAPIETLRRSSAAKTAIKAAEQVLKAEKEAERAAERPRRGPSRKGPGARSGSAVANSRAVAKRALPAGKTAVKSAAEASKPVSAKPAVKAAARTAAPATTPVAKAPVAKTATRPAAKTAAKPAAKVATKPAAKAAVAKPVIKVVGKPAAKPAAKAAPAKKAVARKIAVPRK